MDTPSHLRRVAPLVALLLTLAGCQALQDLAGSMGRAGPTAEITSASLAELSLDGVTVLMDVAVTNSYAVDLPLSGLDYELQVEGSRVASGAMDSLPTLGAGSTESIRVPARLEFAQLLTMVDGLTLGDVVPWTADVGVRVDAPGLGPTRLPLQVGGELPVPTVPRLSMPSLRWDELSLTGARATLSVEVVNGNSFPLDLDPSDLSLSLAGTRLATASLGSGRIDGRGSSMLAVPISFQPADVGLAILSVLKAGAADYALTGRLAAATDFGPLEFPIDAVGRTSMAR